MEEACCLSASSDEAGLLRVKFLRQCGQPVWAAAACYSLHNKRKASSKRHLLLVPHRQHSLCGQPPAVLLRLSC